MSQSVSAVGGQPVQLSSLSSKLCHKLALLFLKTPLKRFGFRTPAITRFDSNENYIEDRVAEVKVYQELFSRFTSFEGKTVMELGCSRGYLLNSFLQRENFTAIGADIDEQALSLAESSYGERIRFIRTTPTSIPLEDESVDVIYMIDVVEHLSRPREILMECHRVLRPGGTMLIHFHPWLGPYGSHLEDIIPFPWPHVLFSMDTLLTVAAKLYDSPEDYSPACYFFDPVTGEKKPNPYIDRAFWAEYLNKLGIAKFLRLIKSLPFEIQHTERIGFGGKTFRIGRYLSGLAQIPGPDEMFAKAMFTVLRK
jgi:SAM-dependent methyltransferase